MNRETFLINLRNITNVIESNDISYDIPFDYRNKSNFANIKILIRDDLDLKFLINELNAVWIEDKDNLTKILYNNEPIIFIKTSENYWVNNFYYYSGEIITEAIDKIASKFNLKYTSTGLYYQLKNEEFLVSNKVFEIFEFFELNTKKILKGFDNIVDVYEFIIKSTYFNCELFKLSDISNDNYFKDEKISLYKDFLDTITIFQDRTSVNFEFEEKEKYFQLIIDYFPNAFLYEKLSEYYMKNKKDEK
jgi:hypothetical protein